MTPRLFFFLSRSTRTLTLVLALTLALALVAAVAAVDASEDGPSERPKIAIEAQDIKGSELFKVAATSGAFVKKKPLQAASAPATKASPPSPTRTVSYREFKTRVERIVPSVPVPDPKQPHSDIDTHKEQTSAAVSSTANANGKPPRQLDMALELSSQEQMVVLVIVICGLCMVALILVSIWNLVRFVWHYAQEQRALRRLFLENDPKQLSIEISKYPATSSLLIRKLAIVRLQHLEFVLATTEFNAQLACLQFDKDTLLLSGLPKRIDTKKEMTFLEVMDKLEQLRSMGDHLVIEIMAVSSNVPARWKRYVDTHAWLTKHDECIQQLSVQSVRVQQLSSSISDLLMDKLQAGEVIQKGKFVHLLSALRQSSAASSTSGLDESASRSGSTSMSMSSSIGSLRNGAASKDEFSFFVKAFDEINEQHQVKQELEQAMKSFNSNNNTATTTTTTTTTELEFRVVEGSEPVNSHHHHHQNGFSSDNDHDKALLTRKLEKFVDRAEMLEVTHFEEVERAQYALENARRENFCAAIFNKDAKVLENVESLALNFVSMGAERKDAVLKAGEILANRSNTMLLVNSLRGMFDELRKQDIMKMNERRKRDAAKQIDKRERMSEKFRMKQQLVVEKLELQRQAQRQKEEEERLKRVQQEQDEWRRHMILERKKFVWMITKLDILLVLLVMGLVFFESLRQLAFIKPVCRPEDTKLSGMFSMLGATNSLAVLGCQVAYGAKMAAILLLVVFAFFILSQLNLLVVVLPVAMAIALYHVRAEWMNMLFRVPLVVVVYGFNSTCLYLLNRSEEAEASSTPGLATTKKTTKRRMALSYVVFPLLSVALSVLVGIGIACDDPQQCATTAYRMASPVVSGLTELAREAYGF